MSSAEHIVDPEPFTVTRWRCPCCQRTHSSKSLARQHIARCWHNPAVRSCKTCIHYTPNQSEPEVGWIAPESCGAGIDLTTAAEDNRGHQTLPINCPKWGASHRPGLPGHVPCHFCGGQSRWMWSAWNESTLEFVPVHPDCWHLVQPPGSGGVVEHAPDCYVPPTAVGTR